jgi:hypothetical protein
MGLEKRSGQGEVDPCVKTIVVPTFIAVAATPDNERNFRMEGVGKRSCKTLAAPPRNLT